MTVAVRTLNGLIFYANVIYANENFLYTSISNKKLHYCILRLNLELGIDTCYFPGMDTYIKTWLQLAFPAYIILLVVLIIIISSYSTKFSNLIGKKDPVATLATLILLSYFLKSALSRYQLAFLSILMALVKCCGSLMQQSNISPESTFLYSLQMFSFSWLVWSTLLFSSPGSGSSTFQGGEFSSGQGIQRHKRSLKPSYHKPFTPKHRYWTGLLLIVRVVLYLVAATNVSNDPTVALTAINFTVTCCIFALKQFFGSRLYRKWPVDVLEIIIYLNTLSFVIFTSYCLDIPASDREAAAYTSVIITFIALLLIILYYVYTYTTVFSKIHKTKLGQMIDRLFIDADPKPKPERHWSPPPDDDIH